MSPATRTAWRRATIRRAPTSGAIAVLHDLSHRHGAAAPRAVAPARERVAAGTRRVGRGWPQAVLTRSALARIRVRRSRRARSSAPAIGCSARKCGAGLYERYRRLRYRFCKAFVTRRQIRRTEAVMGGSRNSPCGTGGAHANIHVGTRWPFAFPARPAGTGHKSERSGSPYIALQRGRPRSVLCASRIQRTSSVTTMW